MDGPSSKSASTPAIVPASVLRWFESKGVEELEAKEWEQRTLYPHTLKRKRATSKGVIEVPVMLRVPTIPERSQAQVDACRWTARLIGWKEPLPPPIDLASRYVGRIEFDNMSVACLASICIREVEEPHRQFSMAEELANTFGTPALAEVSDRLDVLSEHEDPRLPVLDEEMFRRLVFAVAEAGDVSPLLATAGRERSSFIVSMASLLATSPMSSSWPQRRGTSTPAETQQPSSGG